jgi:hypothetical protein
MTIYSQKLSMSLLSASQYMGLHHETIERATIELLWATAQVAGVFQYLGRVVLSCLRIVIIGYMFSNYKLRILRTTISHKLPPLPPNFCLKTSHFLEWNMRGEHEWYCRVCRTGWEVEIEPNPFSRRWRLHVTSWQVFTMQQPGFSLVCRAASS